MLLSQRETKTMFEELRVAVREALDAFALVWLIVVLTLAELEALEQVFR